MSGGVIIPPWRTPPDESVIKLLQSVLEDARKPGGPTSVAIITVSGDGTVQTPARGHQVREIARGVEELRNRINETHARAVNEALANPQAPLRPMT